MNYLRDIEDFAREWNVTRIEFCRRFERNRAEVLKEGVFSYTSWYMPRTGTERMCFTIRYTKELGVTVYHGNGDKMQQGEVLCVSDLTA